ncbi:MAG: tRNA pseudouridine(38-40) synthase TruA [Planctomycetota bacterium]|nr:MAG: tRNA pseudouridine(38-40) synthase TruA [Planctomycetota bacterium]
MSRVIKLTIAYDGSRFHGWQRQAGVRTVQEEVETVARRVLRDPVDVVGASRTDAGVHAAGQVAHVVTSTPMPTDRARRALADRLPDDVTIVHAVDVPRGFHASRDALGKLYRYRIAADGRKPVERLRQNHVWRLTVPLDLARMRVAARRMVGTHDFAGFANAGSPRETTVRTVRRVTIRRVGLECWIDVEGDGFLYNQIRIMVGTLVEIGRGHWPTERVDEILETRDRRRAGPTAPPEGLCLQWIRYPAWLESANDG